MSVDDGGPAHLGKVGRTAVVVQMAQAGMCDADLSEQLPRNGNPGLPGSASIGHAPGGIESSEHFTKLGRCLHDMSSWQLSCICTHL